MLTEQLSDEDVRCSWCCFTSSFTIILL